MNICIFCSAYEVDDKYTKPTRELAALLANDGHHLVFGGSDAGLMHVAADTFRQHGGKIYGIIIEAYRSKSHKSADELVIAKDLGARKAAMLAKSDAVITLPGGIGTLDELTEIIELKKQKHHNKPIIILNTDGFYGGFIKQLERMRHEGFTPKTINDLFDVCKTPNEVQTKLAFLNAEHNKI